MKILAVQVGITSLKRDFDAYIDMVRAGTSITITQWGRPVARLEPLDRSPIRARTARHR
jgi:prevent-host-death family protein